MQNSEGGQNARACAAAAQGFNEDGVRVEVVYNENLIAACAGGNNEFSRLIGVNLARGRFIDGCKTLMCGAFGGLTDRESVGGLVLGVGGFRRQRLGSRALILPGLVEMPFCHASPQTVVGVCAASLR
jgi:hypothetical protein